MMVLVFGLFSFANGSTKEKKKVSPHSRENLDFGGVRGEEEYHPKLPVRSL